MNQVQTFEDVPAEQLDEFVKNLQSEVPREAIEVNRQPNGKWLVRVLVVEAAPPSGSFGSLPNNPGPSRLKFKRTSFH